MAKLSNDKLAESIGLPDQQDKLRIRKWMLKYEQEHPGEFKFHRDAARARLADPEFAVIDSSSSRRYLFELPEEFGIWLGQAYPLMFKAKTHTRWFVKHFPELLIPERF